MLLIILPDKRRDCLGHFKRLTHTFIILNDTHIEMFLNIFPDIVNMFIERIAMILLHLLAHNEP